MLMKLFRNVFHVTITGSLRLLALGAALAIAAQAYLSMEAIEARALAGRKAEVQAAVESAHALLAHYGALAESGKLGRAEAQRAAIEAVRALRWHEREYFWINDLEPRMIMHPHKPDLDGQGLAGFADPNGKRLFVAMVEVVRASPAGAGFVDYAWPRPGRDAPVPKTSFVKAYAPWGWMVGSGVYVDDVTAEVAVLRRKAMTRDAVVAGGLMLFAWLIARVTQRVLRDLRLGAARLEQAVKDGRLAVRAEPESVSWEFRCVLEGMNRTMDAFAQRFHTTADYVARIAEGEVPPTITEPYPGEFEALKASLNACVDAVRALAEDTTMLSDAAHEGRLDARADTARHRGNFRTIVEGVDRTLDAALAPIREASDVLDQLARRDLRARVRGDYHGDHARLAASLNATAEALHDAITQVAGSAERVHDASAQIAAASGAVAEGAAEQASSLVETRSTLEGIASMARRSAASAEQMEGLFQLASAATHDGTAAMDEMAGAMERIKGSAQGTSEIIQVINEIAFQTNLLALNAAVEAARAGEAGRSFAVVADEVRNLALRSKEAARQTEELIRQSVRDAGDGAKRSRHVSDKLGEIAGLVTQVTADVAGIAEAAKKQNAGIEVLSAAVSRIDNVTQQNAANSEESSAAATELADQAAQLATLVGAFQVTGSPSERVYAAVA